MSCVIRSPECINKRYIIRRADGSFCMGNVAEIYDAEVMVIRPRSFPLLFPIKWFVENATELEFDPNTGWYKEVPPK